MTFRRQDTPPLVFIKYHTAWTATPSNTHFRTRRIDAKIGACGLTQWSTVHHLLPLSMDTLNQTCHAFYQGLITELTTRLKFVCNTGTRRHSVRICKDVTNRLFRDHSRNRDDMTSSRYRAENTHEMFTIF